MTAKTPLAVSDSLKINGGRHASHRDRRGNHLHDHGDGQVGK